LSLANFGCYLEKARRTPGCSSQGGEFCAYRYLYIIAAQKRGMPLPLSVIEKIPSVIDL
jgi:hypothetical protein